MPGMMFIGFSPLPAKLLTSAGFTIFGLSLISLIYLIASCFLQNVFQPGGASAHTQASQKARVRTEIAGD